jgi:hypothetical protein
VNKEKVTPLFHEMRKDGSTQWGRWTEPCR